MYTLMREFADSWVLLMMFAFFVGVALWVFRPGSKQTYRETANIPFQHEDYPATDTDAGTSAAANAQSKEA